MSGHDVHARQHPHRLTRWLALTLVALVALLGTVAATPPHASAATTNACTTGAVGCFPRMGLGLSTPGLPRTTTGLTSREGALGRPADVALTFTSFRFAFDGAALQQLAVSGRMPMVTFEPFDALVPEENRYPLRAIADGAFDTYLEAQALRIRDVGRRVAVRFGHEMNGSWYPWGAGVNGNTPQDYVDAYRHVHDVFHEQGVRNVTWVWSPATVDTAAASDLAAFYPGDDYVDWAGLSVYLDATTDTWANTVAPTLAQLDRVAPDAPVWFAETGVLPGPERPAMVRDLLDHLLRTPRAIGFTWFDIASREDWRIDGDLPTIEAVRDALASGWYADLSSASWPSPLAQVPPQVNGTPVAGEVLTAQPGTWRGATGTTGRWLSCAPAAPADCRTEASVGPTLGLSPELAGRVLRYEVDATGPGGTTTATSPSTAPVLLVPARPARPRVEARAGALRVSFPAAPAGTTHWRLRLDGRAYQLVPVGTADYWLTGLTDGVGHTLALTAVASSSAATLESAPTTGTVASMTQPYAPYVSVTGPAATYSVPRAPSGAEGWLLTVDGTVRRVPLGTTAVTVTVPTGRPLTWSLAAAAGTWDDGTDGATTPGQAGTFTAVAAPDAPVVTPGPGRLTFALPQAPAGATAWRLTVGPTSYPDLPVGTSSFTVQGLYPGVPASWTLRAVNGGARSVAVTGATAALP